MFRNNIITFCVQLTFLIVKVRKHSLLNKQQKEITELLKSIPKANKQK